MSFTLVLLDSLPAAPRSELRLSAFSMEVIRDFLYDNDAFYKGRNPAIHHYMLLTSNWTIYVDEIHGSIDQMQSKQLRLRPYIHDLDIILDFIRFLGEAIEYSHGIEVE
jgi:hypothetical protein